MPLGGSVALASQKTAAWTVGEMARVAEMARTSPVVIRRQRHARLLCRQESTARQRNITVFCIGLVPLVDWRLEGA
ncbi:MAG: hypothetical protein A2V70_20740 [Planctomycetes bacterium RBG_13_63_9]|nr:MAG: hypothetical protein A2V70_20740 [Planctomycetes bacterium RBG_13_63_9]